MELSTSEDVYLCCINADCCCAVTIIIIILVPQEVRIPRVKKLRVKTSWNGYVLAPSSTGKVL